MRKGQITPAYVRVMARTQVGPIPRDSDLGPCLDCSLHQDRDGYPMVWVSKHKKSVKASRVVLVHLLGREVAKDRFALHKCDRASCVRAEHLYEGTLSQNSQDRDRRTGNPCPLGSKNGSAKLVEHDIDNIRWLIRLGCLQSEVARIYGVVGATIRDIRVGNTWTHI